MRRFLCLAPWEESCTLHKIRIEAPWPSLRHLNSAELQFLSNSSDLQCWIEVEQHPTDEYVQNKAFRLPWFISWDMILREAKVERESFRHGVPDTFQRLIQLFAEQTCHWHCNFPVSKSTSACGVLFSFDKIAWRLPHISPKRKNKSNFFVQYITNSRSKPLD